MGRIEPVSHQRPFRMFQQPARLRDGKTRRVARQDRLRGRDPFQARQQCLLDRQVFGNRFGQELRVCDRLVFRVGQAEASQRGFDLLGSDQFSGHEGRQILADTLDQGVPDARRLVETSDVVAGQGERLGDAMAHRPQPEDGDSADAVDRFHGRGRPPASRDHDHAPTSPQGAIASMSLTTSTTQGPWAANACSSAPAISPGFRTRMPLAPIVSATAAKLTSRNFQRSP